VIIPVHADSPAFRQCLRCVQRVRHIAEEVIVVVDGGSDDVAQRAHDAGLAVVRSSGPSGPAHARNRGAAAACGDILLFVDADVLLQPSAVTEVAEFFRGHPDISALIGSYDDSPPAANFISQYKNLFQHYVHQHTSEDGYTFWGACGAVRRDVFLAVGGFDENYAQPSIEDIELGYRLKAAGHRIRVCKDLQVTHLKRWRAGSLFWSDFFRRALPWTALILRSGRLDNDLNIDWASRVKVLLIYALLALLTLSAWWTPGLLLAGMTAGGLLAMDTHLLGFFRRKRGTLFAVRVIPWQWFYYGYCGLAFGIGLGLHLFGPGWRPRAFRNGVPYCAGQRSDDSIPFEPNPHAMQPAPVHA
jgi:GT2 family glycosyltransferase